MNVLNKLSVKAKIIVNNTVLIMLLIGASAYGLYAMSNIGKELKAITEEDIPLTNILSNITIHQLDQAIHLERALRHGLEADNEHTSNLIKREFEKFEYYSKKIEKELVIANTITDEAIHAELSPEIVDKFSDVKEKLKNITGLHIKYEALAHSGFKQIEAHDSESIIKLAVGVEALEDDLDKRLENLVLDIEQFTEKAAEHAQQYELNALTTLFWIALLSIIIGVLFALVMFTSVVKPLNRVVDAIRDVSSGEGDLTRRLDVKDGHEFGVICNSFNHFIEKLHGIMSQISSSSMQLGSASEELSVVTSELSNNNESSKSEIDQVATAMNEMTATVAEVANNASRVVEAATNTNEQAASGNKQVNNVIGVIGRLAGEITNTSDAIKNLEEQSDNIGVVLDVIKTISEQTNLLALNAAIEAARAGEQGRGFAVVADEVRTLAGKTQQSAFQIEEMIDKLQSGAKSAVTAMGVSHEIAQQSVDEANDAGDSLQKITESMSSITDMNTQIAGAAEEQTSVAEEINRNIININDSANHAAVSSGQTASSSQELAKLAESLQLVVSNFKL